MLTTTVLGRTTANWQASGWRERFEVGSTTGASSQGKSANSETSVVIAVGARIVTSAMDPVDDAWYQIKCRREWATVEASVQKWVQEHMLDLENVSSVATIVLAAHRSRAGGQ